MTPPPGTPGRPARTPDPAGQPHPDEQADPAPAEGPDRTSGPGGRPASGPWRDRGAAPGGSPQPGGRPDLDSAERPDCTPASGGSPQSAGRPDLDSAERPDRTPAPGGQPHPGGRPDLDSAERPDRSPAPGGPPYPAGRPAPDPAGRPDSAPGPGGQPYADPAAEFLAHRGLLFGTAYRMLGSVADAEDVIQDAWLAWSGADRAAVREPRAYLVRTVTNLSLNRLTSARATRETYFGPWLPEPLLTAPDAADTAETADTVSTAMLVVLETLGPVERAVFLLHEVFGYSHTEIAGMLERTEPAVRQIAYRARAHMRARRPRFDTDPARRREVTSRFLAACAGGDLNAVMELLAPDVTTWTDGGGKVTAAVRPLLGASASARWLLGVLRKLSRQGYEVHSEPAHINGELNILWTVAGTPVGALSYDLTGGVISGLRLQINPDKLDGIRAAPLTLEP